MKKVDEFNFEGKKYEVRVKESDDKFEIKVFLNEEPANGYSYFIDKMTNFDILRKSITVPPVDSLIQTAISDVKNKNWERYLEAIEHLKN